MPILFYIIGNKVGLSLYVSNVPAHLLVVAVDNHDKLWGIESTNKGKIYSLKFYVNKFSITDAALANKVYLQPLRKKEMISVMLANLASYSKKRHHYESGVLACDLALKYYPNYAEAFALKGKMYWSITDEVTKFKDVPGQTDAWRTYKNWLESTGNVYYSKATSLGWVEEPEAKRKKYMEEVRRMRENAKRG